MCWLDPSLKTLMNHPKGIFCSLPTFFLSMMILFTVFIISFSIDSRTNGMYYA